MHASAAPGARQVPAHETFEFAPRRSRHLVVIPVINEGDRIRRQLERLRDAATGLDVVIADGGSSDGSLDPGFLRAVGVRALLVKRGPGKLSAQLRMAYAWALDQGYEGTVTIDGNGKDGVDAIPRFVEALDAGCDFVQGSRYLPGGAAINTPWDRHLAVRLVHAPLIWLGTRLRYRYTDTTNGFRGLSRRLLAHPRMDLFRDVFSVYSLLFYVSVRAPRIGLRVCEVPVTRAYPPKGKTPTKISGLRGRLALLKEVALAALGAYDPPPARARQDA